MIGTALALIGLTCRRGFRGVPRAALRRFKLPVTCQQSLPSILKVEKNMNTRRTLPRCLLGVTLGHFAAAFLAGCATWTSYDESAWVNPPTLVGRLSYLFAPFHPGRLAFLSGARCWVPGPSEDRPVFAPAGERWAPVRPRQAPRAPLFPGSSAHSFRRGTDQVSWPFLPMGGAARQDARQ